jgi:hypothetical protein
MPDGLPEAVSGRGMELSEVYPPAPSWSGPIRSSWMSPLRDRHLARPGASQGKTSVAQEYAGLAPRKHLLGRYTGPF